LVKIRGHRPRVRLHFANAALHRRIDANDGVEIHKAVETRFALAKAWDNAYPSTTSWNQFSQVAGQALIVGEVSLAVCVLEHASTRACPIPIPTNKMR